MVGPLEAFQANKLRLLSAAGLSKECSLFEWPTPSIYRQADDGSRSRMPVGQQKQISETLKITV